MAEGFEHVISGWGLSQEESAFEQPPDLSDAEDFKLTKAESSARFGPAVSEQDIDKAIKARVPAKTRKTTMWVMSVFRAWCDVRGVVEDAKELELDVLADLLPRFVMEARRQDKTPYPPNTLMMLVAGIQRYLRENGKPEVSIFGDKDARFARTRSALDARMKELTREGVGTVRKQAEPLSREQEDQLWSAGIFSVSTGWGLVYALFWYNCKLFGLRGGDEHRNLTREQFAIENDRNGRFLHFMGRASKNVQGGLRQRKVSGKDLKIYADPTLGDRCVVDLFNHYFAYIPRTGPFYRKPLHDNPLKFSKQVIGKNKLGGLVKEMCTRAGFSGNYTNHSGKVTCATELFNSNVDEQLIMRQTGHRSNAVRAYKRPGADHDMLVSSILQPPRKVAKREPLAELSQLNVATIPVVSESIPPPEPKEQSEEIPVPQKENTSMKEQAPQPTLAVKAPQPTVAMSSLPGGIVLNFNFGVQNP